MTNNVSDILKGPIEDLEKDEKNLIDQINDIKSEIKLIQQTKGGVLELEKMITNLKGVGCTSEEIETLITLRISEILGCKTNINKKTLLNTKLQDVGKIEKYKDGHTRLMSGLIQYQVPHTNTTITGDTTIQELADVLTPVNMLKIPYIGEKTIGLFREILNDAGLDF